MLDRKILLLHQLGFTNDITEEVIAKLAARETQIAQQTIDLINESRERSHGLVLTDGNKVRIHQFFNVSKYQIQQVELVTGMQVVKVHQDIDWLEWIGG